MGYVNDIYESENKQEQPSEDLHKELEHKPADIITVKSSDEFINVVKEYEGRQENENEEKRDDLVTSIKEDESRDSFMNDIYESEGKQEQTGEKDNKEIEQISYTLKVIVVEATDLVNKDKIGKSDPYVIVKFQDQEFRSPTVKNSLSPKWNFISSFKVSSEETENIKFDVYDDDFGNDELQGSFSISLADAFDEAPDTKWFDLKGCKTGKIAISFEFNDEVESDIDDDKKAETMVEGGKEENMEALTEAEAKADEKEDTKAQTKIVEKEDDTKVQIEAEVKKEEKTEIQAVSETKAEDKEDTKAHTASETRLDKKEDDTKAQIDADVNKEVKEDTEGKKEADTQAETENDEENKDDVEKEVEVRADLKYFEENNAQTEKEIEKENRDDKEQINEKVSSIN